MKKGDKCYIIVTNSTVHYNGYPVCLIREDEIFSSGEKFTLVCDKDYFSGHKAKRPQFYTDTGYRDWTPKNIHDFYYDFYLIDEKTYLKNRKDNFITHHGVTYIIR